MQPALSLSMHYAIYLRKISRPKHEIMLLELLPELSTSYTAFTI